MHHCYECQTCCKRCICLTWSNYDHSAPLMYVTAVNMNSQFCGILEKYARNIMTNTSNININLKSVMNMNNSISASFIVTLLLMLGANLELPKHLKIKVHCSFTIWKQREAVCSGPGLGDNWNSWVCRNCSWYYQLFYKVIGREERIPPPQGKSTMLKSNLITVDM